MAYGRLDPDYRNGHRPGLAGYANLYTGPNSGWPYLRGLRGVGPTSFTIGPDGQWSVSSASAATPATITDQVTQWLGESTVLAGVPNSLIALGMGLGLFAALKGRR